jgi:hypothetical protein
MTIKLGVGKVDKIMSGLELRIILKSLNKENIVLFEFKYVMFTSLEISISSLLSNVLATTKSTLILLCSDRYPAILVSDISAPP